LFKSDLNKSERGGGEAEGEEGGRDDDREDNTEFQKFNNKWQ